MAAVRPLAVLGYLAAGAPDSVSTSLPPLPSALGGEVLLFLVLGLLAGAHCLGMCGPLAAIYARKLSTHSGDGDRASSTRAPDGGVRASSDRSPTATERPSTQTGATNRPRRTGREHLGLFEVRQQLLFNLGRATTYAAVGGIAGLFGGTAFVAADQFGAVGTVVRASAGVAAGVAIAVAGLGYLLGRPGGLHGVDVPGFSGGIPGLSVATRRLTAGLTSRVDDLVHTPGIALLGAGHGLLPCPILYPAYFYALALGDPVRGAVALGAIGVGTIPTMLAIGIAAGSFQLRSRSVLHRALGATLVVAALVPLTHGLVLLGAPVPHVPLPHPTFPS